MSQCKKLLCFIHIFLFQSITPMMQINEAFVKNTLHTLSESEVAKSYFNTILFENNHLVDMPLRNNQSIGHVLLNLKKYHLFDIWLSHNPDLNKKTNEHDRFPGSTILHTLCTKKDICDEQFTYLFEKIVTKNSALLHAQKDNGSTPAHMCVFNANILGLQLLKKHGSDFKGNSKSLNRYSYSVCESIVRERRLNNQETITALKILPFNMLDNTELLKVIAYQKEPKVQTLDFLLPVQSTENLTDFLNISHQNDYVTSLVKAELTERSIQGETVHPNITQQVTDAAIKETLYGQQYSCITNY